MSNTSILFVFGGLLLVWLAIIGRIGAFGAAIFTPHEVVIDE